MTMPTGLPSLGSRSRHVRGCNAKDRLDVPS